VLNLLGLVYFKTNAFPEAEVIYRRLIAENPNVFILHSNLGLILFKQGKQDEAEHYLLRAVELRPNYAKSHLYLGLLYRQKKKFALALEHLRFAGADKLVREVEWRCSRRRRRRRRVDRRHAAGPARRGACPCQHAEDPGHDTDASHNRIRAKRSRARCPAPRRGLQCRRRTSRRPSPPRPSPPRASCRTRSTSRSTSRRSASTSPQDRGSVEDVHAARERLPGDQLRALACTCKRGTVSSYSGNLKFVAESGLLGTTAQTLVKAVGQGKIFVYEKGRKTFLLDLNDEFIYVEGSNLLALEDTLTYRVEPIYDAAYQRKIDTVKIFGKGSLAISTSIEPLTLRVTREYPLSISSNALVAWTGNLIPTVDRRQVARQRDDRERRRRRIQDPLRGRRSGVGAVGASLSERSESKGQPRRRASLLIALGDPVFVRAAPLHRQLVRVP
jgi:hypothetical protein